MSKYRHIRNMVVALAAAILVVMLAVFILPYAIYALVIVTAAIIAYKIGEYVFACIYLLMLRRR